MIVNTVTLRIVVCSSCQKLVVATLGSNATTGGIISKRIVAKRGVIAERCVVAKQGVVAKHCVIIKRGL